MNYPTNEFINFKRESKYILGKVSIRNPTKMQNTIFSICFHRNAKTYHLRSFAEKKYKSFFSKLTSDSSCWFLKILDVGSKENGNGVLGN